MPSVVYRESHGIVTCIGYLSTPGRECLFVYISIFRRPRTGLWFRLQ